MANYPRYNALGRNYDVPNVDSAPTRPPRQLPDAMDAVGLAEAHIATHKAPATPRTLPARTTESILRELKAVTPADRWDEMMARLEIDRLAKRANGT